MSVSTESKPFEAKSSARSFSRRWGTGLATGAIVGVVLLVPIILMLNRNAGKSGTVDRAETRSAPRTADEETVLAFLKKSAHEPASVELDRWGPHLTEGLFFDSQYLRAALEFGIDGLFGNGPGRKPAKLIRCVFRSKNALGAKTVADVLVLIQDGRAFGAIPNADGDEWRTPILSRLERHKETMRRFEENRKAMQNIRDMP